jgi:hypothetical protein
MWSPLYLVSTVGIEQEKILKSVEWQGRRDSGRTKFEFSVPRAWLSAQPAIFFLQNFSRPANDRTRILPDVGAGIQLSKIFCPRASWQ